MTDPTPLPNDNVPSVLVTGGAHRLGGLLCEQFAQAGWRVWCHYQRLAEAADALCAQLREGGAQAQTIGADLGNETDRQRMMQHIAASDWPLTCLVNNASSFEPDSASTLDLNATRRQLEVNLLGPLDLARWMAVGMADTPPNKNGGASVIHVLDQKVFNPNPDYFSYSISKAALERAVVLQAQALAPQIRVCGVAPGLMFLSGPQTPENFAHASQMNMMRQALDPQQVAATCVFLAQNPAITGITLAVDNGQHLLPLPRDVMHVVDDWLHDKVNSQ
jgi:NAD(P)-dependent dehydrogenase (short-subunit alcohol dehydrogenase family)